MILLFKNVRGGLDLGSHPHPWILKNDVIVLVAVNS